MKISKENLKKLDKQYSVYLEGERLADFCYAAIDTGYDGWFGEDQFTYRTEPVKSMALSRELFGNAMKKALGIYAVKDKLEKAQSTGDATATIEVVKKYLI